MTKYPVTEQLQRFAFRKLLGWCFTSSKTGHESQTSRGLKNLCTRRPLNYRILLDCYVARWWLLNCWTRWELEKVTLKENLSDERRKRDDILLKDYYAVNLLKLMLSGDYKPLSSYRYTTVLSTLEWRCSFSTAPVSDKREQTEVGASRRLEYNLQFSWPIQFTRANRI